MGTPSESSERHGESSRPGLSSASASEARSVTRSQLQSSLAGMSSVRDGRRYKLVVSQHPERARMCGFGDKDRRPLSPSLIVKLVITDEDTGEQISPWQVNSSLYFIAADLCHPEDLMLAPRNLLVHQHAASVPTSMLAGPERELPIIGPSIQSPPQRYATRQDLYHTAGPTSLPSASTVRDLPPPPSSGMDPASMLYGSYSSARSMPTTSAASIAAYEAVQNVPGHLTTVTMEHYTRNLVGAAVTSANVLRDENDEYAIFFVLQDLSVRTEGVYRIRLVFTDLAQQEGTTNEGVSEALAETYTEPFTVYSPRRFPGMLEPTELSKKLAAQGVKIAVRSDKKKRQRGTHDAGSSAGRTGASGEGGVAGATPSGEGEGEVDEDDDDEEEEVADGDP